MKKKIIVADDIESIVIRMQQMLASHYEVRTATTGLDVLQLCHSEKHAALIIDVIFGSGMSGLETASRVRKLDKDIKIIIMSAEEYSSSTRQRVVDLGATFLEKPIEVERIHEILEGQENE